MARNIYSFIKIEKRQTKRGIYASAFGIASLICMAVLTIEITQLLTRVGSFDVDDLILNTAGGIAGYLLFYIMNKIRSKWDGA